MVVEEEEEEERLSDTGWDRKAFVATNGRLAVVYLGWWEFNTKFTFYRLKYRCTKKAMSDCTL